MNRIVQRLREVRYQIRAALMRGETQMLPLIVKGGQTQNILG